jgi:hypothetical protein
VLPGERIGPLNRYQVVRQLGVGVFSVVVECLDLKETPPVCMSLFFLVVLI